ncbi:MAG: acyl-CoA dehydrogenase family protein [Planctomycetota bacterium]
MTSSTGMSGEMLDMVLETVRTVLERDLPPERSLELDANEEFPTELIRTLLSPDVGLHLVFLPEEAGGLGGGAQDAASLSELMAKRDLGVATAFLAIALGLDPIRVGGTEEQKQHWLTRIADEGMIVAYGVTEPEAGSNVGALHTTAEPITDAAGKTTGYRLNGSKQFITNGGTADLYTILAKAPGGPSFFVVERSTPGISPGKTEDKHGIRASNTTSVILEDCEIPAANLLGGQEGEALKQARTVFGFTRLLVGSLALGCAQGALERAVEYAKTRIQFGTPLIEKQGYNLKLLVPHLVDLEAGRAYVEQTARAVDGGDLNQEVEGAIAKYWSTEAGNRAADAAVQALGGYGYAREYMVEKARRDVRITNIFEGTSEIQQNIIGMYRWKATAGSKGAFYEEMAAEMDRLQGERPELGAGLTAAALRGLNATIQFCHKTKKTRNQIVMFTLADMITRAEVAAALCRKAAGRTDRKAPVWAAMSRIFARKTLTENHTASHLCATGFLSPEDADAVKAASDLFAQVDAQMQDHSAAAGLWTDMEVVAASLRE